MFSAISKNAAESLRLAKIASDEGNQLSFECNLGDARRLIQILLLDFQVALEIKNRIVDDT